MLDQVEVLRAVCCIAGLDGTIGPRERAIFEKLAEDTGVGAASVRAMIDFAKNDPNYYEQQFRYLRKDPEASMKTILRVAVVDGKLGPKERFVIDVFARKLGIADDRYRQLLAAAEAAVAPGKGTGNASKDAT